MAFGGPTQAQGPSSSRVTVRAARTRGGRDSAGGVASARGRSLRPGGRSSLRFGRLRGLLSRHAALTRGLADLGDATPMTSSGVSPSTSSEGSDGASTSRGARSATPRGCRAGHTRRRLRASPARHSARQGDRGARTQALRCHRRSPSRPPRRPRRAPRASSPPARWVRGAWSRSCTSPPRAGRRRPPPRSDRRRRAGTRTPRRPRRTLCAAPEPDRRTIAAHGATRQHAEHVRELVVRLLLPLLGVQHLELHEIGLKIGGSHGAREHREERPLVARLKPQRTHALLLTGARVVDDQRAEGATGISSWRSTSAGASIIIRTCVGSSTRIRYMSRSPGRCR